MCSMDLMRGSIRLFDLPQIQSITILIVLLESLSRLFKGVYMFY